ncbi:MAG TPA: hypothetical protein VFY28_01145 [Candidatus Paceibacterota bacterium]|nr:hypothetical protein [Candidatus Paceibacterota bacterium]
MTKIGSIGWLAWQFRGWLLVGILGLLAGFALIVAVSEEPHRAEIEVRRIVKKMKVKAYHEFAPTCLSTFDPSCRLV